MHKSLKSPSIGAALSALFVLATPLQAQPAYRVMDIWWGSPGSGPASLTKQGRNVVFTANDFYHGTEMWTSDGTTAGTMLLRDISPGMDSIPDYSFARLGATMFCLKNNPSGSFELWKTDGTPAGTVLVWSDGFHVQHPRGLTATTDSLYLATAYSLSPATFGNFLWKSDGTSAPGVAASFSGSGGPGNPIQYSPFVTNLTAVGSMLFYTEHGGLYKADQTGLRSFSLDPVTSSYARNLTDLNGVLFLAASDGASGDELWKSDGTPAGTVLVKDIDPGAGDSRPANLVSAVGRLFFTADDGVHGRELWTSDGTAAGTVLVQDVTPGAGSSVISSLVDAEGTVFFVEGSSLWRTDGTAAGTSLVKAFAQPPAGLAAVGGRVFFAGNDGVSGTELWTSNGSLSGTRMVQDIAPGGASSAPAGLTLPGSLLFFSADDGVAGRELWALSALGDRSLDFDGDLKGDLAVYHPASGQWSVRPSSVGSPYSLGFGGADYDPVPGDYDGDGRIDMAAYHRPTGIWYVRSSVDGVVRAYGTDPNPCETGLPCPGFGGPGYVPVRGDFDGDGRADLAVYHQASALWFFKLSTTLAITSIGFGGPGYDPVPADYDGDGKTDPAVYHSASGLWFMRTASTGTVSTLGFGGPGYAPVRGDFDGDGRSDVGVYHQASGLWFIHPSSTATTLTVGYGGVGYSAVPEDYDGDGRTDFAVYHPSSGLWFTRSSRTGSTTATGFGGPGFDPVN